MRSPESPPVDVAAASPERQPSPSSSSNGNSGEVKHLTERLNVAQVKVKRLHRLEAALVDFFMEVMDRSSSDAGVDDEASPPEIESSFARGKRKEQFLKKAEGDPISLLNALRTHLRLQFAEQKTQQGVATLRASKQTSLTQQKELDSRNELQRMELACSTFKKQQDVLLRQLDQSESDQARTRRQHRVLLEKLNAQVQTLRSREQAAQQLATSQQQELAALKEARDALAKAPKAQKPPLPDDGRPASTGTAARTPADGMSPLPTATAGPTALQASAKGEFFGTPAENQTLRRALRDYEFKMARMEAAQEDRKREVQRLQQQLIGLRQNTQLQKCASLEKEARRLRELAEELKTRLAESDAELLRTKGALKEREAHVRKMKDEYAKLFSAVQKQKPPSHYSPSRLQLPPTQQVQFQTQHPLSKLPESSSQLMDHSGPSTTGTGEHPYVVEHYRSVAARLERDVDALQLQIRRMMASEHQHKQKTRVLRAEKEQLVRDRDQLREDLDRLARHSALQSVAVDRQQQDASAASRVYQVKPVGAPQEVKRLQERNAFLEERFRKTLRTATPFSVVGVVSRLRSSRSTPAGLERGADYAALEGPEEEGPDDEEADCRRTQQTPAQTSSSTALDKIRPTSALATASAKAGGTSDWSLDAATLQALQQVTRTTRVRPQSATPLKLKNKAWQRCVQLRDDLGLAMSADSSFDGLGGPKHERVVRALEQVNGLRYRTLPRCLTWTEEMTKPPVRLTSLSLGFARSSGYHPAPQEAKKALRFDSESDSDEDSSNEDGDEDDDEISDDEVSDDEKQRRRQRHARKERPKRATDGEPDAPALTLDDHIENLLRKTRTLALLRIASHTAQMVPCSDSDDESEEGDDVVADELETDSCSAASSPKHGASLVRLASLASIGSTGKLNGLLGTAAMRLARTLSAFLCLPHAISYGDLEAITEKLLDSSGDQFDEEEYRDLIDCHVDSPRDSDLSADAMEDDPIWKRRNSHLLSKDDPNDSMYLGVSASGRMLGSFKAGSSASLHLGKQGSGTTMVSSTEEESEEGGDAFDEAQYLQWRTQVKEDYLAWVNAKVEATKRRKSRAKKDDAKKKPRWLLLYEASLNPTRKYQPDSQQ
ncbi:hypothetical protein BBJ28_00001424 [Nothophytophthora sp. Chile5]|nr:hypothetical protein BBJ28_00001424 [Nothophytophthora sp. Chile5]